MYRQRLPWKYLSTIFLVVRLGGKLGCCWWDLLFATSSRWQLECQKRRSRSYDCTFKFITSFGSLPQYACSCLNPPHALSSVQPMWLEPLMLCLPFSLHFCTASLVLTRMKWQMNWRRSTWVITASLVTLTWCMWCTPQVDFYLVTHPPLLLLSSNFPCCRQFQLQIHCSALFVHWSWSTKRDFISRIRCRLQISKRSSIPHSRQMGALDTIQEPQPHWLKESTHRSQGFLMWSTNE